MRTKLLYITLGFLSTCWIACQKHDYADGQLSPISTLESLRALHKGSDVTLSKNNLFGAHQIVGVVISDPDKGNAPAGQVILQNKRRNKTRGIIISLENAANYKSGDSLIVDVEGGVLKRIDGSLQITGLTENDLRKVSSGNTINIQSASSYSINQKPGDYESTLVQIKAATVSPTPIPGDTFLGEKSLKNGVDSVVMHTSETAGFATEQLPASATFTGIVVVTEPAVNTRILQLWPRSADDISDPVAPVDPNGPKLGIAPVIITGFVNDAKGGDGNYEYFQFKATRDIDFSVTPMAVVTCTNAASATPFPNAAPEGGWATGGGRTYKFDLREGSVVKGEYFYVGGSNKKINGANSTDISSAKWIRSIAYVSDDGDGIGSKSGGLLPNSGNAGGIAIFEGTTITEKSVPVDVVFFGGTGKTTIFNETTNVGYRIVANDHYNPKDPATNAEQPFFYQGTNLYVIPHITPGDLGAFVKLGGVFNTTTKTWTTPRAFNFFTMTKESTLPEIESGNVTVLTD